jgi:Xaa-Pro aminopeptidase
MEPTLSGAPGHPEPLPVEVFRRRRERFLNRLGDAVAVIGAAPELFSSRDTEVPYRPNSDLFYLTGFEEPRAVALLTPHDPGHRFTLFVRGRDPGREAWSGPRAGVEGAREQCGADAAYPAEELQQRLPDLLDAACRIVYPVGDRELEPLVLAALIRARGARQRRGVGPVGTEDLDSILGEMRRVKDDVEVERIRVAARISERGHLAAMRHARPGVGEWEVEAELEAEFRRLGAAGPAFESIVGSGANATVLHYVANRDRIREGDLVLVDAGAQWGMYCADITRTFPASGRFSAPQRELYDLVLEAEEAGIAAAKPGGSVQEIHQEVLKVLVGGMMRLGLLPAGDLEEAIRDGGFRRFYMHQSSHWLGLDVHDVGPYMEDGEPVPLCPGMVLTVEPGLYVPAAADDVPERFRGIGIRIEDDVLVTEEGPEVLTRGVPVAAEKIEALMR